MSEFILGIDQGTTSTRALLFRRDGSVAALTQKELSLKTPHNGWVEQDPAMIWEDTLRVVRDVLIKGVRSDATRVAAIGITNQRETTLVWDAKTGQPIYNAIVWQDRRTADYCATLKAHEKMVQAKTGLLCDPYFSATKLKWILDNVPDARTRDLKFGTIDTYLIWRLTSGRVHATDATNASRTMLFNIHTQQWDDDLLKLLDIPASMLPDVRDSGGDFGVTDAALFGVEIPIRAVLGDQQAALFGQSCFKTGMVKSTYGTGCFALMNSGDKATVSTHRLLTTVAWRMEGKVTYAIEGSIFVAGAAVQFLRDNLKFIAASSDSEKIAASVGDSNGVIFVPALTGFGAPYWDPNARGAILGLTRGTTQAHIVRATLEAQAYQTRDLMEAMAADTGIHPASIRVDGGLANNDLVCQMIANQLDCLVQRPVNIETTVWGAAAMAGLMSGWYDSLEDLAALWRQAKEFTPFEKSNRDIGYSEWKIAIRRVMT